MKILLIEDEPLFATRLEMLVELLGHVPLGPVDNASDALALVRATSPDLALVDVNIAGDYDGIETAGLLQREATFPIIFVTSLKDDQTFARASRGRPANFIIKPFDDTQLRRAIELALLHTENEPTPSTATAPAAAPTKSSYAPTSLLYLKVGKQLRQIQLGHLLSLTADGHYCSVRWEDPDGQVHRALVRESLNDLATRLPEPPFLRVHRSVIVNEAQLTAVDLTEQVIYLSDGSQVPLAKRRKHLFVKRTDLLK